MAFVDLSDGRGWFEVLSSLNKSGLKLLGFSDGVIVGGGEIFN